MNEKWGLMNFPLHRYSELLAQYLQPLKYKVVLLAALIFATIGLQLVNPQIIRYFIDAAVEVGTGDGQARNLLWAALAFLGAALLLQGLGVAATYVSEDVGWRSTNKLREDLTFHCLALDMTFHNEHKPGEMIERIDGDVANIAIFFAQFVVRILGNMLLLIGVLIVLLWTDWRISLVLAIYSTVALAVLVYLRRIAVPRWKAAREASAELFGFLEEHLSASEDIRSSGAVPYVMRNLFKFSKFRLDKELKGGDMDILMGNIWNVLYALGQGIAITTGFLLYRRGLLTVGSVYLIIHYTDMILQPLNEITRQIQNFQKAAASIERVDELKRLESKIQAWGQKRLPDGPLAVTFEEVSFSYAADEPVLRNVSFCLEPGRVLGLLGRTGSGKTTLTRLLFRLYDPNGGAICLGNDCQLSIREIDLDTLRSYIGMVTQEVQLFRGSIRDNITLFNEDIPDHWILEVIEALGLSPWYEKLPEGLKTELQSEGGSLSAGEAQLLAFTRVFLHNPGLVILDEASSRLDPATERLIERAMDKLLQDRTGIIVAHRLSTVQRADEIMILQDGRIQEHGPLELLANDPASRFYSLLRTGMEEVLV